MKVLCTGIGGFLGSHIAQCLLKEGHKVVGIDSLEGGTEENVPQGAHFSEMDICDEMAVDKLFYHFQPDAVIHCAAFASENLSHNCRLHTHRSIVMGSATLVNAAVNHGVKVFVSMSSIAVYGRSIPPFKESDPCHPIDPYGSAKLCMENDLKAAHEFFGLNYIIFRPHNIIGVRQSLADSTRNVASIFIRQALQGKPLTVFGDGFQTRCFSPVSYVASVIASSIDKPDAWNETYNIGGSRVMTVMELATIVNRITGRSDIVHLPERHEVKHAQSSHEKVEEAFPDASHEESIEVCLSRMVFEAKNRPMPEVKALPRIEIEKQLNPAWTS